jgi:hypothetical protein
VAQTKFENWVIYYDPLDFPNKWVCRRFDFETPSAEHYVRDSLIDARDAVLEHGGHTGPFMGYCLGRRKEDDPKIREVWI